MRKAGVWISLILLLSACGDPLAGIPRISEIELADDKPSALALPTDAEVAREGFFGTEAALASDAPADIPAVPLVSEPKPRGGLMGLLRRAVPQTAPPVEQTVEIVVPADSAASSPVAPSADVGAEAASEEEVTLASLSPAPELLPDPKPARRGLFGRGANQSASKPKPRTGVDQLDVEYGTVLPYGIVARTCASKRKPLGQKVESATANGYKLYDSNPRATGARTFYITGFDDGCPRQLTAAHVLFGAPSFYELLHYGPTGKHLAYGATDKAYEDIKTRVCRVRKGKPCGSKMNRLEKETFFVNSYERADDNTRWSELLVHDSVVVASALKTN